VFLEVFGGVPLQRSEGCGEERRAHVAAAVYYQVD
jgi:hypothetical protein